MNKCMKCMSCSCGRRYFPQRYIVAITCLLGVIVMYGQRVSLNLAITAMTNKSVSASTSCPARNKSITKTMNVKIRGGVIDWTNAQQNAILGGFYAGYFVGHLPVGLLCDKFGARYVFLAGIVSSSLTCVLTPIIVTNFSYIVTLILRGFMGLGQSVLYPAISSLYSKWVPMEERSLLGAFSFAANALGIIFGGFLTGMMIQMLQYWPVVFYLWGGLGMIWCVLFAVYIYSQPSTARFITTKEKTLLATKISPSRKMKIPWLSIFSNLGIWAIIVGEIGHDFTIYTLMNNMPKYLSDVLHYDIAENALASSLPYFTQWVGGLIAGQLLDYLIKKKGASVVWCRRIATFIGNVLPAVFILAAGYMGCNGTAVIVMFSLNLFAKGPFYAGLKVNHLDMTKNFAGLIMAIYNGIGALAGFVSPYVINLCAPNNTLEEWQLVFWIVLAVAVLTTTFYCVFCTSTRAKWDIPEDEMEAYLQAEEEKKAKKQEKKEAKKEAKKRAKEAKKGEN